MALNAGIILQGQAPNVFDSFTQGQAAGRQNALADLYKNQGGAIMAGDPNALNALAQFDPQAAMGVQQQQFGFEQAKLEAMRAAEAHAAQMSAAEADATAKQLERGIAAGMAAQTPEQWDQLVTQFGAPDLVGQFGNREAIANTFMGVAEVMKRRAAEPLTDEGKRTADIRAGFIDPNAAPSVDPEEVDKFRKEFSGIPAVKAFSEQSQAFGRIVASAENPSAAGDIALIFNYMKLLDPGSVVREGEFATAQNAGGVDDQVINIYNRLLTGERLNDEQRADFVNRAGGIYDNASQVYSGIEDQFRAIAETRGYPVSEAVIDFRYPGPRGTAGPVSSPPAGGTGQPAPAYQLTPEDDALLRKYGGGN